MDQSLVLTAKLLKPPITAKLLKDNPSLLRLLISTQKRAEKEGLDNQKLMAHCQAVLSACCASIDHEDHLNLSLLGDLLMVAGALPGFPAETITAISRQISALSKAAPTTMAADSPPLTIGQIKGIENSPGWVKGFSRALNKEIVVVGKVSMIDKARTDHGLPVYVASECLQMKDFPPESLPAIDLARQIFDGVLVK